MKKIILMFFTTIISCNSSIQKNQKLTNILNNKNIPIRGKIIKIPNSPELRFDYYDVYEKDTSIKTLEEMNYQSGGYSWEGIVYGAIKLSDENIFNKIHFDPESEGLAIWSSDEETLKKIGRLISSIKKDDEILIQCIKVAEENGKME